MEEKKVPDVSMIKLLIYVHVRCFVEYVKRAVRVGGLTLTCRHFREYPVLLGRLVGEIEHTSNRHAPLA